MFGARKDGHCKSHCLQTDGEHLGSPKWAVSSSPAEIVEHERIQKLSHNTFSSSGNDFDVIDIFDREEGQGRRLMRKHVADDNADDTLFTSYDDARIRIISISGSGSIWPLDISRETACRMWKHYNLEPEFRDIVCNFGSTPNAGQGGSTNGFVKTYDDGIKTCAYVVQYFEENHRKHKIPWSQRQTGLYHRHVPMDPSKGNSQSFDLFVVLNSTWESNLANEILSVLKPDEAGKSFYKRLMNSPFAIHEILLRTCMSNWVWYLRSKGVEYRESTDGLFATCDPKTRPEILNFEPFRNLRQKRDNVLAAVAYCHGTSDVLDLLKNFRKRLGCHDNDWFDTMEKQIQGHYTGVNALLARMDNALALLEYSIDLKSSHISSEMNHSMVQMTVQTMKLTGMAHELAKKSADDSASIRIITFLTLFYLPGTFVSGLFGMNFFGNSFDPQNRNMTVARNLWIYVLFWLPLTMGTFALYLFFNWRQRKNASPDLEQAQNEPPLSVGETHYGPPPIEMKAKKEF